MGGHSAAAGHGNNQHQQYTMQVRIFYLKYSQMRFYKCYHFPDLQNTHEPFFNHIYHSLLILW